MHIISPVVYYVHIIESYDEPLQYKSRDHGPNIDILFFTHKEGIYMLSLWINIIKFLDIFS